MRKCSVFIIIIALAASCSTSSFSDKISSIWPFSNDKKEALESSKRLDAVEARIKGEDATSDKTKTLFASGHPEYPPIMWQEGDRIVGVGPEIIRMVFEELGVTVDSAFKGSWAQVQEAAKEGDIDAIVGIYRTEKRRQFYAYSDKYAKDPVVIFVAKDKAFPYKGWGDLIGKRGATTVGDSYGEEFGKFIASKLTVTSSVKVEDNFKKLLSGEADYFIFALYLGLFEAEKLGVSDKVEYLPTYAAAEDFHIAISKKSKYLTYLPEINKKIEAFILDGTIDKLVDEKMKYYMEGIGKR